MHDPCAGELARPGYTVSARETCRHVVLQFQHDPDLFSMVLLDEACVPQGLLRRLDILLRASGRYFMDIYRNRSCTVLMDRHPLIVEANTSLADMARQVAELREAHLMDGFIIVRDEKYLGVGRFTDVLQRVTQLQLLTARNANPLTQLPGNAAIEAQLNAGLAAGSSFHLAYFDLDHFKPFNDVYGYKRGDDMILLCARAIGQHLDAGIDFLGHVGGDDFIAIVRSPDWEVRMQHILAYFAAEVSHMFRPEHVAAGGYESLNRTGQSVLHPLTSLSIGVVTIEPDTFHSHAELAAVAAEAKKQAKALPPNSYFLERRVPAYSTQTSDAIPTP